VAATADAVKVRSDLPADIKGLDAHELEMIVVRGRGLGQFRRVTARQNLGGDPRNSVHGRPGVGRHAGFHQRFQRGLLARQQRVL